MSFGPDYTPTWGPATVQPPLMTPWPGPLTVGVATTVPTAAPMTAPVLLTPFAPKPEALLLSRCEGNTHVWACDHVEYCTCGDAKRQLPPPPTCLHCGR